LKLKYDKQLSNLAFDCNLRHYDMEEAAAAAYENFVKHGGAVQVDPGFSQITLRLLSTLETKL